MSAVRLRKADLEALERLQERVRRQLDPAGYRREQEERRTAREAAAAERRFEAERRRAQREIDRLERERIRLAEAAKVRHCRICSKPLRKDAAPSTRWCSACLVSVKDACPDCGTPKRLDASHCRRCHAAHHRDQVDIPRTNNGRCRTWRERPGCVVQWGNLDHRHCHCGRPMSADPDVELCGHCMAKQLATADNGYCKVCDNWLELSGRPEPDWEPGEPRPGRVCGACQLDFARAIARSSGLLAALFHTERIQVGGAVTIESDLAI